MCLGPEMDLQGTKGAGDEQILSFSIQLTSVSVSLVQETRDARIDILTSEFLPAAKAWFPLDLDHDVTFPPCGQSENSVDSCASRVFTVLHMTSTGAHATAAVRRGRREQDAGRRAAAQLLVRRVPHVLIPPAREPLPRLPCGRQQRRPTQGLQNQVQFTRTRAPFTQGEEHLAQGTL